MYFNIKHKIKISLSVLAAVTILASSVTPTAVFAEEKPEKPAVQLQVAPTAIIVTMKGGDTLEGKESDACTTGREEGCVVHVRNTGSETFEFKAYVTPYSITSQDNQAAFSSDKANAYTQISRWLTLSDGKGGYNKEVRYTIDPDQTIDIPFRVDVPDEVPGGMQRAAIWAEAVNNKGSSGTMGISTTARAGVVIAGHTIGVTNQDAEITNYDLDRFTFGGPLSASATIKNTGNTDFIINTTYTAETFMGKVLKETHESTPAYPGVEYNLSTEWDNTPYLGIFSVKYKVSAGGIERNETHVAIILPIPIIILLISLLTVIIIWIIIIIRKRKERKARMLV